MNVSLYQAAAAMNAHARWQDVISQNLASSSIPGFKKQDLSFAAVQAAAGPTETPGSRIVMPRTHAATSFEQGELRFTGAATDVAIEGRGFFEAQLPNGSLGYTRDGEFHVNNQGQLVTKQGFLVLGESGPIQVDRNNPAPISISATGEVSQGEEVRGKLKIVDFKDRQQLTPISAGYFTASGALAAEPLVQPSLRQQFLEGANTSPVEEMAHLISASRGFEMNQRLIQMHDERMGRAISELGTPG